MQFPCIKLFVRRKSSLGIFLYRAIENRFVTKMYALLVNFIFGGFQANLNIVGSTFVIQLENRKKFQLLFFDIFNTSSCISFSLELSL